MASSTGLDIISAAMRLIGAIGVGQTPTAAESQDALRALNRMLSLWSIDGLTVFTRGTADYALIPNQQKYTIGKDPDGETTADFDALRPNELIRATLLIPQASGMTLRNPIKVIKEREWDRTKLQAVATPMPTKVFYEKAFPFGFLYFYGVPTTNYQVELRTTTALTQLAAVTDDFAMPDGYEEAVTYNLALRLAPEFGAPASADVREIAIASKAVLMSANATSPNAECDAGVLGTDARRGDFNWLTGEVE